MRSAAGDKPPRYRLDRLGWKPPEPLVQPPAHPPQSISPYFFLSEVMRLLAQNGIGASPLEPNSATSLAAAGWLLVSLGVVPDVQPGDPAREPAASAS